MNTELLNWGVQVWRQVVGIIRWPNGRPNYTDTAAG